ncbi:hypothetical protein J7E96_31675 [Streptomyces sp. ISL-96]|uniref:hypothetical protein n=1 Tax=Streptomyces sp. ISL-96 TaxID=2819191 RepID=UPI001BE84417|nr:hypothetical protein [Streptomyces sp. ISL-96]MBT2492986.1 hypothetical protein [Streptomyces sp. ISL-96]
MLLALPATTVVPVATAAANVGDTGKRPPDERPDRPYPDIDVRGEKRTAPTARQLRAARELDGAGVRWGRFGTPRLVSPRGKGALTGASDAEPGTVALHHVRDHADLYGLSAAELSALEVVKSYCTKHNGVRHVFIGQADPSGVPVHGGRLSVAVDKRGRIVTVAGSLVPEVPDAHASDAARRQCGLPRSPRRARERRRPAPVRSSPRPSTCPRGRRRRTRSSSPCSTRSAPSTVNCWLPG